MPNEQSKQRGAARPLIFFAFLAIMFSSGARPSLAATAATGDLIVVDTQTGQVIRVDPATGAQSLVLTGPKFSDVATEANGLLAASFVGPVASGVGEIDPVGATYTTVSSGGSWSAPFGVAGGKNGHILAADEFAFIPCTNGGTVWDVDPVSGTAVYTLCLHYHPLDVVLESSDSVLAASDVAGLVRYDPAGLGTGGRVLTPISAGFNPQQIALAGDGTIYAVSYSNVPPAKEIFRVDPMTGGAVSVSSGGQFVSLGGIAVAANGDLLVTDSEALPDGAGAKGALFRVNPLTGAQTVVSSGGMFRAPIGVAIVGVRNGTVPALRPTWGALKVRYR